MRGGERADNQRTCAEVTVPVRDCIVIVGIFYPGNDKIEAEIQKEKAMDTQNRKFYYTDSNSVQHEIEIDRERVNRDCDGKIQSVFITAKSKVIEQYFTKGNGSSFQLSESGYVAIEKLAVQFAYEHKERCPKCGSEMEGEHIVPDDEPDYMRWTCPECRDFEDF